MVRPAFRPWATDPLTSPIARVKGMATVPSAATGTAASSGRHRSGASRWTGVAVAGGPAVAVRVRARIRAGSEDVMSDARRERMTGLSIGFLTYRIAMRELAGTRIVEGKMPFGRVLAKCVPSELTRTGVSAVAAAAGSSASIAAAAPAMAATAMRRIARAKSELVVIVMVVTGS